VTFSSLDDVSFADEHRLETRLCYKRGAMKTWLTIHRAHKAWKKILHPPFPPFCTLIGVVAYSSSGKPIGWALAHKAADEAKIAHLAVFVAPRHRRKGVACQLAQHLRTATLKNKAFKRLPCTAEERVAKMFLSVGFNLRVWSEGAYGPVIRGVA
jgi:GNAT superfamily N-acetyltransferase